MNSRKYVYSDLADVDAYCTTVYIRRSGYYVLFYVPACIELKTLRMANTVCFLDLPTFFMFIILIYALLWCKFYENIIDRYSGRFRCIVYCISCCIGRTYEHISILDMKKKLK